MQKGALLAILAIAVLHAGPASAQIPADVTLDPVPGLPNFSTPVGLKHAGDGSGRLFVVELGGTVRVIDAGGSVLATSFVDLGSRVTSGGERGLLDLTFHPNYEVSGASGEGKFYLHYSAGSVRPAGTSTGDTVIAEFTDNGDPDTAVTTPDRIILTVSQDFSNHNGGQMRFGPDGYLWIGLGDGGSGGDPCNRAQTLDPADIQTGGGCGSDESVALLGKMLRIDVDTTTPAGSNNLCGANGDGSAEYAVPGSNPFAGGASNCGEIFYFGLRNPWRWSFDRQTDEVWIGDVGQNQWEEIDLVPAPLARGQNAVDLGWRCYEGTSTYTTAGPCPTPGTLFPVMEYSHSATGGCSVTGGYRYRGPIISLRGEYIFGDYCTGEIWFGDDNDGPWAFETFDTIGFGLRSFGEDEEGNVYAFDGSTLLRFNGDVTDIVFADGFES